MTNSDIHRLHIVRRAKTLLARLAEAGCERDAAGNRTLLYSHYASLVLLSLFNPVMHSLRGIQTASGLQTVQKQLGTGRASLGSLSESARVFDPALLVPLIEELLADRPASHPGPGPRRHVPNSIPRELAEKPVAAGGSALAALPQVVRAAAGGDWKLHLQFRPLDGRPAAPHLGREYADHERDVLRSGLAPGCVYLADRGYEQHARYNAVVAAKSGYVTRGQDRPAEVVEERLLTDAAVAARVASDAVVRRTASARTAAALDHPVRRVVVARRDQGRPRGDRTETGEVVIYTGLLDPPAEVIAAVYQLRWSVELFFRFLRQVLGLRRPFSDKPEAVAIQVYCAVIAALLRAQVVGGRVTADAFRMLSFDLQGWADDEELLAFLTKLREREA
jgi:hypothetical protein